MSKKVPLISGYAALMMLGGILILILLMDLFDSNSPVANFFLIAVIAAALSILRLANKEERKG